MSKPGMVFGLFGAFLVGCFATQVAPMVVRAARAGTSPKQWEYSCVQNADKEPKTVEAMASKFGQQGWEMSAAIVASEYWVTWCFKRPLP